MTEARNRFGFFFVHTMLVKKNLKGKGNCCALQSSVKTVKDTTTNSLPSPYPTQSLPTAFYLFFFVFVFRSHLLKCLQ
jgi:F0F1-type ATP synthase membrane subunit a